MSHLKEIKSSYLKHLVYSLYFCFLALLVVITGLIHAIFPFVFEFTPYKIAKKIVDGTEQNFK
jgi:ABC-type Na+ efflux pump permease subunit